MAPPAADGKAPAGKCFCNNKDCQRTNFIQNKYCHICGWVMPDNPITTKPKPKGAGKGASKGAGKGAKGASKGRDKSASQDLCTCCGGKGHAKADCRQRDKECHSCGKIGHIAAVCRSKPQDAAAPKPAVAEDAFAAEAERRGMPLREPPPPADVAPQAEHSASSISAMSKAKDAASKKLDKLIERQIEATKALAKIQGEVAAAAIASQKAERAFLDEVAATHQVLVPKADTTAIDIGAFMDNIHDLTKIKVDLGSDLHIEGMTEDDTKQLQGKVESTVAQIAQHIHNTFGPLKDILDKHKATIQEATESAAKKRKSDTCQSAGAAAGATSPAASASSAAATPGLASPASPSPAEKEATAADKRAVDAAAAAVKATEQAEKAKSAAADAEKVARETKELQEKERVKAVDKAKVAIEREDALKTHLPADAEIDAI